MHRIGLTGGIATGKSHVAARLRESGIPVVDADVIAREVVAPATPGFDAVLARFGRDIVGIDGALDRRRLGSIVFANAQARHDLEAIVHPAVRRAIERFFNELPSATLFAVADIPLLYETGRAHEFARVIVVACEPATQISRVMARDLLSKEEAERRVRAQLSIEDKVQRADHVIRTDGTHAETDRQVEELVERLRRELSAA
jgi:dephospho-CoA kinase